MALDDNKISFGVEVSTGQSEESINKVINRIDGLKDKINELKALRKENREDANIFANYTKSIRDTERELSKLQSTYNSWIQKATNVDAKPIGDVKKQAQEFISLLKQWDGQSATFQKQVMNHFMIPNSAIDQLKLYKNIINEIQGYGSKKIIDSGNAETALKQLVSMAKDAQQAIDRIKASLKDAKSESAKKLTEEAEQISRIRKQLGDWDGKGSFSSTIKGFDNLDSYSRQLQALRRAYEELNAVKGKKGIDNTQVESAIDSIKRKYDELLAKKSQVDAELKKGAEKAAKASKQAADEESKNTKKVIDEYTKLKLKMADLQEQIKNNYVTNKGVNPEAYATNFSRLKREYEDVAGAVNNAERQMNKLSKAASVANSTFDRLKQRSQWFIAAFGVNLAYSGLGTVKDAVGGVEQSMVSLAQVLPRSQQNLSAALDLYKKGVTDLGALKEAYDGTGHSVNAFGKSLHDMTAEDVQKGALLNTRDAEMFRNQLNQMQSALQSFAVKYGESYQDVMSSATLWGRMYKDNNIILTMTDAAMKLAVADSFSIVEANKNLESSVAQWGFKIKDNNDAMIVSNKICDSWTAIAHNMAVSAQDLSAANQRAATSMHVMNVSFDVGQALIATMLRNTQQSGAEIGNAIKSIMGSIHSDKAIKDLESWGVEVYKVGKNGQREFRNVGNVLVDLMIKAQNTDRSMEDLLKHLSGGKWQWNKMGAMLNLSDFLTALRLSTQSYGFTQQQVAFQMDTVTRRFEAFRQEIIKVATANGSLSTIIKGVLNVGTSFLQFLDRLGGQWVVLVVGMNAVWANFDKIRTGFNRAKDALVELVQSIKSFSFKNVGKDLAKNLFGAVTVILDLVTVFRALTDEQSRVTSAISSTTQALEAEQEVMERQKQFVEQVPMLAEAYQKLGEQIQQTSEDDEKRNELLEEQSQIHDMLVQGIGEEDAAMVEASGNETEAIDTVRKHAQDRYQEHQNNIKQMKKDLRRYTDEAISLSEQRREQLRAEGNSWLGVAWTITQLGNPIRAFGYLCEKVLSYIEEKMANFSEALAGTLSSIYDSSIGKKIFGPSSDSAWIERLRKQASDLRELSKNEDNYANSLADQTMIEAQGQLLGAVNTANGFFNKKGAGQDALQPGQLGGMETGSDDDDDGSGKSKKGKNGSSSREGKPSYDGIGLKEVNEDNYHVGSGVTLELTSDTLAKLRALDEAVYTKFGEHVNVSSAYRPGDDDSNHGHKVAFDLSGGVMDDPDKRYWVEHLGPSLGLFVIPEYSGEAGAKFAQGDNVHFSNVTPGIYGEDGRWAEGLWSEDNAAPTLGTILGKGIDSGKSEYVDNSAQRQVYDLLYSKMGLTDKQAWAAMANIDGESSFDPTAEENTNSTETGIGLMQWSGQRRKDLEAFADARGTDWRDLKTQLAFIEYEYNSTEKLGWENFKNFVTGQTTPEQDVEYFAGPNGVERAGSINLANRMKNYYEYDSHYAKGMSYYDSNPSKQKKKEMTPEERAEKEAQRFQQMFSAMDKSLELLGKSFSGKYKAVLESVQEDQKYFGSNVANTTKQLDTYSQQLKSVIYMQNQYQQAITKVSTFLDDKGVKAVLGVSKDEFLKADLAEQQKMMSKQSTDKIYQPIIVALNEIMKLKQNIQEQDKEYHKAQLQWVDTYRTRLKSLYEDTIWSEQSSIKEWEIRHSNEKYDEWYKNFAEQSHLEAIARQYRGEYEEAQKPLLDENGHQVYDSEGNSLNRIENDPKKLEELREKWLSAEEAAKKYSATLKNSVQDSFHDLTKSVLLEGGSLRDKLKELWKGLADDALSLLLSGGKSGTNSPLGNLLRMFMLRHQKQNVQFYDKQHFDYGSQAMWDTSAEQFGAYDFRPQRNYWRQFMGQAKYSYYNPMPIDMIHPGAVDLVASATKLDGKPFNPLNPVPVTIVNGGPLQDALTDIPGALTNKPITPSGAFDYGQLGSFNGGIVGQKASNFFANATRYNWMGQLGSLGGFGGMGFGAMPIGQKLGMFTGWLPWLFGLFGHHAEGGEVDKEQISYLAEGNKKEYVIPTETNRPRGVALWRKAGKDLGVLKDGSPVEPNFKNKEIAQNGIMSVQVKQQAIYMEQMRQQNKTLLNILTAIADNQQSGGNGTTVAQPIVMKQSMDMDGFGEMLNRFNRYGYNR